MVSCRFLPRACQQDRHRCLSGRGSQRLDETDIQRVQSAIDGNRELRWKIVQRGFWANGKARLRDYLAEAERYTVKGRAEAIRCPTLLTAAENDPLAEGAQTLFDALQCRKTLVRFRAAEGAGDHCEMMNRSAVNRLALDWLDEVLARAITLRFFAPASPNLQHSLIVASLSHPGDLSGRDDNASADRLRLRLAMNRDSARFVGLFERSASWRPAQ